LKSVDIDHKSHIEFRSADRLLQSLMSPCLSSSSSSSSSLCLSSGYNTPEETQSRRWTLINRDTHVHVVSVCMSFACVHTQTHDVFHNQMHTVSFTRSLPLTHALRLSHRYTSEEDRRVTESGGDDGEPQSEEAAAAGKYTGL